MNKFYIFMLFISLVYLTSFSCPTFNNKLNKGSISEHISKRDTIILGEWTIISYEINKATSYCYSCSVIKFLKDGTGQIDTPTNDEHKFQYSLIDDKLLFNSKTSRISEILCKNTEFHYEIKEDGGYLHLILSSKTNDCKLVLSKKK